MKDETAKTTKEIQQKKKRTRKPKRPHYKVHYSSIDIQAKIKEFLEAGYKVVHTKTRKTECLHVPLPDKSYDISIYRTDELISFEEMNLQNACKREFKKNEDKIKPISNYDIKYNSFSPSLKDVYKDSGSMYSYKGISEIDLTKAYYYAAKNLGYISEEFFNKCMQIPKSQRLRLIGSIATRKTIFEYDPTENKKAPVSVKIKQDEKLRLAWDNIVTYVDRAMNEVETYLGKDFLFYWVDGVYFKDHGLNAKKIQLIFKKHGFDSTYEKLHRVDVVNKNGVVELDVYKGENGEIFKPFTVPMYNQKAYKFE